MNKEFFIEQLTELRGYFVDVLLNGLEGQQLKAVDKEIYKMAITSINFLIDFLER